MVDIFKEEKFKLLALTETKLKGKGEVSLSGVSHLCRCSGDGSTEVCISTQEWRGVEIAWRFRAW